MKRRNNFKKIDAVGMVLSNLRKKGNRALGKTRRRKRAKGKKRGRRSTRSKRGGIKLGGVNFSKMP